PLCIYALSLHDALPIYAEARTCSATRRSSVLVRHRRIVREEMARVGLHRHEAQTAQEAEHHWLLHRSRLASTPITSRTTSCRRRSEEHTSELQSLAYLV